MATIRQTVQEWADMVINIWGERMASLGISNAQTHAAAFAHFIYSGAGGDVSKIEFAFDYYLKYTDMGVGRGVSMSERSQLQTKRIQKMWYSKTFLLEARKLVNILADQFSREAVITIIQNVKDNSSTNG